MNHLLSQTRLALIAGASVIALACAASPAAAALPPANGGNSKAEIAHLVADAMAAIKAGKLPLAVIDLKNASSIDPRNGPVRAQLGSALAMSGNYYQAERELRQARKDGASDQMVLPSLFQTMISRGEEKQLLDEFPEPSAPSNAAADILKARAVAFMNLDQMGSAADAMDKSLKQRRDTAGLIMRARIAQRTGALPTALQFVDQGIALTPGNIDASLFKVGLLLASNDLNNALALADQLVAKSPDNLSVQAARIEVLMRLNRNDQAKTAVDAILVKVPNSSLGIYYRALLLSRSGDNKNAWRVAQVLPQEFLSSQPGIALSVAQMAVANGNIDTAASILGNAIGRFSKDYQLRIQLAQLRVRQNNINGALSALEPIRESLDPATAQALVAIYVKANRQSEALGVLEKLTQSGKGTDETTLEMVNLEAQMGQPEQALKDLTTAVNKKPTDLQLVSQLIPALLSRGRFADALAAADKIGTDPAQRTSALILRGAVFTAQHNTDEALAAYGKALQADPKNAIALFGRADTLEQAGRFDEASFDVNTILKLNPRNMAAYLKLAEISARQSKDGQVRSVLAQAMKQDAKNPAPHLALIRYLAGRRDNAGALKAANDLLKVDPDSAEGMVALGGSQQALGRKADAVATFRRLAALTPNAPGPQILLGNALFANGDQAGANAAMKNALKLAPDSADVRLAQINLQFAEKDTNGAIASAQAYQTANPGTQADILVGDTLLRAGRRDQAMAVYQKNFSVTPNSGVLMRMAQTYANSGDMKSASDALSNWVTKNPDDVVVRLEYASFQMQQANNSEASRQFREVLKRDPDNVASLNNLAWITRDQDPKGAIALATRAVAAAPESPEALDTLGWLTLKHAKPADSLPLLKKAHDLQPKDGEIAYHLVLSLDATGSHEAAKGLLKSVLASQVKFDDLAEANKLAQSWH